MHPAGAIDLCADSFYFYNFITTDFDYDKSC